MRPFDRPRRSRVLGQVISRGRRLKLTQTFNDFTDSGITSLG